MLLTEMVSLGTVTVAATANVLACLLCFGSVAVALPTANSPQSFGPHHSPYSSPLPYRPPQHVYSGYESGKTPDAVVSIQPGNTDQGVVSGILNINRRHSGISITGFVHGLTPGAHGFHIHAEGLLTNNCKDAAGHFNPFMKNHGSPVDARRHVGDLGNIVANGTGVAWINILDTHASLDPNSKAFIGNRGIVIHAGMDDLGRGGDEGSLKTGNAGGRVGCGTIVVQENQPYSAPPSHHQHQGYGYSKPVYDYPYHFPHGYSLYPRSW